MFEGCYELSRYAPLMLYTEWYFQSFLKDCVFCVSQYLLFVLLMTSPVEEEALHNLCNPSFNYYAQNNLVKNSTLTKVVYKILFVSNPHSLLYAIKEVFSLNKFEWKHQLTYKFQVFWNIEILLYLMKISYIICFSVFTMNCKRI